MSSVWMQGADAAATFPPLAGDAEADAVVIGGGIAGVTTAMLLADAGLRVLLLEAGTLGAANTGRSTGNLYGTVSRGLRELRKRWKTEDVRTAVDARLQAVALIEDTVRRFGIDCAFARVPMHEAVTGDDGQRLAELQQEFEALAEAGLAPEWCTDLPGIPVPVRRALKIEGQAQLNPYRYVQGLAQGIAQQGVRIAEGSRVTDIDAGEGRVSTEAGQVRARFIVSATHSPIGFNLVQAEMQPFREYGISAKLRTGACPEGIFWLHDPQHSLRGYRHDGEDYLVVVGEKHRTGEPEEGVDYLQRLRDYASRHFDVEAFVHGWSAQQFLPADGLPYIGLSAHRNVYIATGFAADGLTWGTAAATIVSELIQGRESAVSELLTPWRFTAAKSAKDWVAENVAVARHLVGDRLRDADVEAFAQVRAGEGRILEIEGRKFAVHRATDGALSVLSPVCPHLKCHVAWNAEASSWDCPCHGSRFHADGRVLEGPAMTPLQAFPVLEEE